MNYLGAGCQSPTGEDHPVKAADGDGRKDNGKAHHCHHGVFRANRSSQCLSGYHEDRRKQDVELYLRLGDYTR